MGELLTYLKDFDFERSARLKARTAVDPNALIIWNKIVNELKDDQDCLFMDEAFKYAKNIPYEHVGLSADIYFGHPLRVATLAMLATSENKVHTGVLGLLHNVFELSKISAGEISSLFGKLIAAEIEILTVDRILQWDKSYKRDYYERIRSSSLECRVVKIIDKLDNLFVIGINPDEEVRDKYLLEIEQYILPMAKIDLPDVFSYLTDLIEESRRLGFIKEKIL
jgi:(p)ppGpp synthase/HD superfamily hydrolase